MPRLVIRIVARVGLSVVLIAMLIGSWIWLSFQPPSLPSPTATRFTIPDATIIDPDGGNLPGQFVRVEDGVLMTGGANAAAPALERFGGHYLLPGIVDMHSHTPPGNALQLTGHYGLLYLAHGVTTVRDAGDIDGTSVPAARKLSQIGAPFPDLLSCGPFVSRGHAVWPNTLQITSPEEAEHVVKKIGDDGHRCIKAYEGLTPAITRALVSEADRRGMHVIGHVPIEYTMEASGVPDVQHLFGLQLPGTLGGRSVRYRADDWEGVTEGRLGQVINYIVESNIRNTPTVSLAEGLLSYADYAQATATMNQYMPALFTEVIWHPEVGLPVYRGIGAAQIAMTRAALARKQVLIKRLSDAGAVLHIGTDTGQPFTPPGISVWREMRLFERSGIDARQVLSYATNTAYRSLGRKIPLLETDARADFLVFKRDPSESLDNLESLVAVVVGGRLYERTELETAIQASLEHYAAWPLKEISIAIAKQTIASSVSGFR